MESPEAKVRAALNILVGSTAPDDEEALMESFRDLRQHGFGRLEVVVVRGKLDVIHQTKTLKTVKTT